MVAGRLQEKNGFYYIVLSYTDSAGKRRQPWIGTGLPVKGNKKRAEKMLADTRKDFTIPKGQVSELSPDMAFSETTLYATISEDLADTYQALKDFALCCQIGNDDLSEEALAVCIDDFRNRWGMRLLGALRALHNVSVNLSTDDE